ncbi:MAG: hypothetical protein K9G40_09510 [Crocinitomicaceae bacterium]|nr:hypothetical protein [Crocinitomicaceae bacterium]MCF8434272.1 hypothetical protein [Crocinitomicaceae bacterium]
MKFLIVTIFACLFQYSVISQNTGLYGKRTFIEVNTVSNMPIFSWLLYDNKGYSASGAGNSLIQKKDLFDYGFRLSIGRSGKKNTGFSFEVGYSFTNLATPEYASLEDYTSVSYKHERLDVKTFSFMPKIEFTSKGGTLPVGLNHQIGFGISSSKIIEKDYNYQVFNYAGQLTNEEVASFSKNLVNYENKYSGMTFLYAFNIRTPLSKSLMINYGIRYTLNLKNMFVSDIGTDQKYYPEDEVRTDLKRMRLTNVLSFNLGFTYAL